MPVLLVTAIIVGVLAGIVAGSGLVFLIAAGITFVCGLPFLLFVTFVVGAIDHVQNRADYRQLMADLEADYRAERHEYVEDERIDRLIEGSKRGTVNDNRQIHFHGKL